jgi:4-hydroxymandelate oxidase
MRGERTAAQGPTRTAFEGLEQDAAAQLHPAVRDYFAGGAGAERTLRDNASAWDALRFRPSVLQDVTHVSTATALLGSPVRAPVAVAPMGYQRLAHPDGESAMAAACAEAGVVMTLSTYATTGLQDVADAGATGPQWFQTYVLRDRGVTTEMLHRAAAARYAAVVLTVDAPVVGQRHRDRRHGYWLPLQGVRLPNFGAAAAQATASYSTDLESALTPDLLAWVRETSGLPVLVKGVLRGDDALRCLDAGAAGVVVSNHGGRQLDDAVPTADALRDVVDAVGATPTVLVDGGIRTGADVLKALSLGASGVMVGRAALWALAGGGRAGVAAYLARLQEDLAHTMALCGAPDLTQLPSGLVRQTTR